MTKRTLGQLGSCLKPCISCLAFVSHMALLDGVGEGAAEHLDNKQSFKLFEAKQKERRKQTRCNLRTRMQSRKTRLWNKLFEQSCKFSLLPYQCAGRYCGMWKGVECKVWSMSMKKVECWVRNVVCRAWNGDCGVWSVKCKVRGGKCEV